MTSYDGFVTSALLVTAGVLVALSAGLYAAFAYAVMPGLRAADDTTFVGTMRAVNSAIVNPVFAVIFFGGPVFAIAAAIAVYVSGSVWHAAAVGAVLQVGTVAITIAGNVPLNNALEADGGADLSAARDAFERRWTRWNLIRTVTGIAALVALFVAAVQL